MARVIGDRIFNASPSEATQEGKKNMKAAIALGAAALLAAGVTSAAEMKVAADVGYSPHVMASASGGVEGYNVDIMDEIAKRMGIKVIAIEGKLTSYKATKLESYTATKPQIVTSR